MRLLFNIVVATVQVTGNSLSASSNEAEPDLENCLESKLSNIVSFLMSLSLLHLLCS